eukprot:457044_1
MGFNEEIALQSASLHPQNINDAINYIQKNSTYTLQQPSNNDVVQIEESKQENIETYACESIKTCSSLHRLVNALKFYNSNDNKIDDLTQYIMSNKTHIINDYHHIINDHLNEDNIALIDSDKHFQLVHSMIMNDNALVCDIAKCNIYLRSNRQRELNRIKCENEHLSIYIDFLDSIHCYFMHSVDIGYRAPQVQQLNSDENKNEEHDIKWYDQELALIKSYLECKRQNLEQVRGIYRFQNNKFTTEFKLKEEKHNDDEENKIEKIATSNTANYSFGYRYNYWWKKRKEKKRKRRKRQRPQEPEYKAKYSSIKEEVISNEIFCIDKNVYDSAYIKVISLMETSQQIRKIKSNLTHGNDNMFKYKIENEQPLNANNILSVVLYTDYDTLSYNLTKTFRSISTHDTYEDMKNRNREYFNWCKALCETVTCFGTKVNDSNIKSYYHGTSFMYFDQVMFSFNSPTSTTTKLQIATIFAKNNGIILELSKYNDVFKHSDTRYFNCSLISAFAYEEERLFIQPHSVFDCLEFCSIRNLATNQNYKTFVEAIKLFETIVSPFIRTAGKKYSKYEVSEECVHILNNLIPFVLYGNNENVKIPDYVLESFKKWTLNLPEINAKYIDLKKHPLNEYLFDKENRLLCFDVIYILSKRIKKIEYYVDDLLDPTAIFAILPMLETINNLEYSQLQLIFLCNDYNMDSFK